MIEASMFINELTTRGSTGDELAVRSGMAEVLAPAAGRGVGGEGNRSFGPVEPPSEYPLHPIADQNP